MLPVLKHLHFNRTFNYINSCSCLVSKAYYCDKTKILGKIKDKKSASKPEAELCENRKTISFEDEEQILQTMILEKEKDANVRSRLSKECNKLGNKRIRLNSTGLNLHLEHDATKDMCWEDYMFDKTVDNLKKHVEVKGLPHSISPKSALSTSAQGGSPPSSNRIARGEPGKVLFAFIPEEWFKFFIPKTGVCGFGTFLFTFGIFLISKEYYVLEHNFYNGLGMLCVMCGAIKYVGPHMAQYLDKEIELYEKSWEQGRNNSKKVLEEQIEDEKLMQFQAEGQLMLIEAKRENVHFQLEEAFRLRQMTVYNEVLNRLNYQVKVAEVYSRIFHRNLVDYVTKEVKKSMTPEMEKQMFNISIDNLVTELSKSDNKR